MHNRIRDIAYEEPSNSKNYCGEYLGQDYFDALEDSDGDIVDDSGSETDDTLVPNTASRRDICIGSVE